MRRAIIVIVCLCSFLCLGADSCYHTQAHIVTQQTLYGIVLKAGFEQPAEGAVPTPVLEVKAGKMQNALAISAQGAETKIDNTQNLEFSMLNEAGSTVGTGTADKLTVDIGQGNIPPACE